MSPRLASDKYRGNEDAEEDEDDTSEGTSGTLTGYGLFAWPPRAPQGEIVAPYKRGRERIEYIQVPGIFVPTRQNKIFEEA